MSQDNIAYERELGNNNIRGKRGKIPFNVSPVAVEAYKDRIDSEIPVVVPQEVKDIVHSRSLVEQGEKERQDALVGARKDASSSVKGANLDNIGLSRVTPIDTYRMEHEYNVTPSNEINYHDADAYTDEQARRIKEETFKDEEKKASAPVVDEDVPIIDETLEYEPPTEEMKKFEEEKTQAQWQKDYLDSIWSKEDEEAAKKKQKAAQWILAAQMLGDSIGALSNVYWTGKGANAQKFEPGAQKAAAATYQLEQDIRNAREKAAKAQYDATLKKYELEMQRKKDEQAQANWQKTFDATEAYRAQQQKNFEETEARLAEQARLNAENEKIRIDIARQNADIQLKNALDKNKPYPMAVNGEIYEIPIKKINEQIIGSIFAKLPEDVRMSAGQPIYGTDLVGNPIVKGYENPSLADMLAAIGTYGNEETAKEIMKLAGIKTEEVNPKKDKREKENTSTNNTEPPIQAYSAPADEWGSQWRRRAGLDTTDFSQFKRK